MFDLDWLSEFNPLAAIIAVVTSLLWIIVMFKVEAWKNSYFFNLKNKILLSVLLPVTIYIVVKWQLER